MISIGEIRDSQEKKPKKSAKSRCGDNIYHTDSDGYWIQEKSLHDKKDIKRDISGKFVLISDCFFYFGENHIDLLSSPLKKELGRWRQKNIDKKNGLAFIKFLKKKHKQGRHGNPIKFNDFRECDCKKNCS